MAARKAAGAAVNAERLILAVPVCTIIVVEIAAKGAFLQLVVFKAGIVTM